MKTCSKCKLEKSLDNFNKRSDFTHLFLSQCKLCCLLKFKEWEKTSSTRKSYIKGKRNKLTRNWQVQNNDRVKLNNILWRQQNKEHISFQKRERYASDINFKLKELLRSRLSAALKNNQKVGSAISDLGCSIEELKIHLESQFLPNMSWDNHGLGPGTWQIDHICSLYKFSLIDKNQFLEACHYSNLQPLWHNDHVRKTQVDIYGEK